MKNHSKVTYNILTIFNEKDVKYCCFIVLMYYTLKMSVLS
jgi:hypothetical protein